MPGIQRDNKPESTVCGMGITDYREPLKLFNELCRSSQGPKGKVKFIQNSIGGCLTVTSTSTRLFSSISIQTPVLKVLTSSGQSFLSTYGDGGLFYASLASSLVLKGIDSGIRPKILSEVFEALLTHSLEYLNSKKCLFRHPVDFANINFMSSFLRSILGTKPLCRLNHESQKHLAVLILECFLNSVSENENCAPSNNVYVMTDHAENVMHSKTWPGILLAAPELSKFRQTPLSLCRVTHDGKNVIKVALVTASMSGDLEEMADLKLDIAGSVDVEASVVDHLALFCDGLVSASVSVVLCQKVIHPHIKRQLRRKNLLVVDRVGLQPIKYLTKLTGANPIGCMDTSVEEFHFGWIDDVKHTIINSKTYIQLIKGDNPVTTLMLTHLQEQPLCEIKEVTSAALTGLDQLLQQPYVLCGGGCWQAGLVQHIQNLVVKDGHTLADKLELPVVTLSKACDLFTGALLDSATQPGTSLLFNNTNGHLFCRSNSVADHGWNQLTKDTHCCCGLTILSQDDNLSELKFDRMDSFRENNEAAYRSLGTISRDDSKDMLWDSLSVRTNALKMAVLSASAVLRIGQVMESC